MDKIFSLLAAGHKRINLTGLQGSSYAFITARIAAQAKRSLLFIAPSERQAELAVQNISLFSSLPVILYPGFDIPPYTPLSPDQTTVAERLHALYLLLTSEVPVIFVASCESLLRRVMPKKTLGSLAELIIRGEDVVRTGLIQTLVDRGYENVSLVQSLGDISVRGGIVDIFPPGYEAPIRLDFFGDTVESLRTFDPISQRSIAEIDEAVILPASNIMLPPIASPDYITVRSRFQKEAQKLNWAVEALDVIWEKIGSGRRFPGIEFFLPLFYSDEHDCPGPLQYLPENTVIFNPDPIEIERSIEQANIFINQAQNALESLPQTPEHEALESLSKYVVDRHL